MFNTLLSLKLESYPPKRTILFFINTEECLDKPGKSSPALISASILSIGEVPF